MKFTSLAILSILVLGAFLRFYNLNWGNPFYFHPDERNIASLISTLDQKHGLDFWFQGTFSYGTFIAYIVFFIKTVFSPYLLHLGFTDTFSQSIILLRFISSVSSILTIFLIFYIGYKFWNFKAGMLTSLFTAFSAGLIQSSHFGTFESFLTFMYLLILLFSLIFIKRGELLYYFLSVIAIGIASAVKINSIIIFVVPLFLLIARSKQKKIASYKTFFNAFTATILLILITILLSPYHATLEFKNLFIYEKSLLTGALPVFYTEEFFNTDPIIYQFLHVFPFLINPVLTAIFIPSLLYQAYKILKTKSILRVTLLLFFLVIFLPSALLFAKWTRYMVSTLPFTYLIISITLVDLLKRKFLNIKRLILNVIIAISFIHAISYFITAFVKPDTRIEASLWTKKNIPGNSTILSEVYDMGIVPFNQYLRNISLFNFYNLDQMPKNRSLELDSLSSRSDYIILPSQRLFQTRILNSNKFPLGNKFYEDLRSGKLGFKKIYETQCDIFCKITYLGNPVFSFEQTATVFDRPVVFIFKRL